MPEDKPAYVCTRSSDGQHINEQVCGLRMEALSARMDGMDEALKLKERETERRLEGLNELRQDVVRDRDQLVKKDVYFPKMDAIDKWQDDIAKRVIIIETRSVVWAAAIALFFAALQIAIHFWTKAPAPPIP